MHKVIAINLSGQVYQLDERGYDALRVYLDQADAQLASNPDRHEIVRDLEQSLADKFARYAVPSRKFVIASEVEEVLGEIGPVDGGVPPAVDGRSTRHIKSSPKRLYQIRDGALLSGVCNGVAAYFNLDPTFVRIAFVMAALSEIAYFDRPPVLTIGLYIVLMFLMPYAPTTGERPAAHGADGMIPRKVQRGVERVKGMFRGLHHNA
jgi:phage shock protein PspC (stress-responsive transcriptional regulator)